MSDSTTPNDPAELQREIEDLQAQREALEGEVRTLEAKRTRQGTIRAVAVGMAVVLACVSFTGATVGVWAKRSLLNNEVWAERVGPLGADPAVQAALADWLTGELMQVIDPAKLFAEALPERGRILAVPLANAVRGFVHDQITKYLATPKFAELWAAATTRAHDVAINVVKGNSQVVSTTGGQIVVNFIPLIDGVLAWIGSQSPEIFGKTIDLPTLTVNDLPSEARDRLSKALGVPVSEDFGVIHINDNGSLAAAKNAVRIFQVSVWALVVLTIILIAFALWVSHRRRRTLLQLLTGLVIGMVLVRRLGFRVNGDMLNRIHDPTVRAAAQAVARQFVDPLVSAATYFLWAFVVIAAVALLTGPYRWAVAARRQITRLASTAARTAGEVGARATDEATVAWLRANTGALQIGGVAVAVLILFVFNLSWTALLLLLIVLAAYEAGVWWLGESAKDTRVELS